MTKCSEPSIAQLTVLAALAILSIDILTGPWDHDGSYFLMLSWLISEGFKLYSDLPTKYPPFMFWVDSFYFSAGLPNTWSPAILALAWNAAVGGITFVYCLRRTRSRTFSYFITALWFVFSVDNGGNHVTLELAVVFFTLCSLVFLSSQRPSSAVLSGIAFAAVCFSKQVGVANFGEILVRIRTEKSTKIAQFVIGVFTGVVLVFLYVWDVPAMYQNLVVDVVAYAQTPERHSLSGFIEQELRRGPTTLFLSLASLPFLIWLLRIRAIDSVCFVALVIGLVGRLLPFLARPYTHYYLNLWPLFVFLLVEPAAFSPMRYLHPITRVAQVILVTISGLWFLLPEHSLRWQALSPGYSVLQRAANHINECSPMSVPVLQLGNESAIELYTKRVPPYHDSKWGEPHERFDLAGKIVVVVTPGQSRRESLVERLLNSGHILTFDDSDFTSFGGTLRVEVYSPTGCQSNGKTN